METQRNSVETPIGSATVMDGAVIGRGSSVGAGALVLEGMIVPPFSLVVGNPGKVRKTYPPNIIEKVIRRAAESYMERVRLYSSHLGVPPIE